MDNGKDKDLLSNRHIRLFISPSGLFIFKIILALLLSGSAAYAQNNGQITISVVNQTTGSPMVGQPVSLMRHQDEGSASQTVAQGVTDPTGQYVFSGLTADGAHYVVETRYGDVGYLTNHMDLSPAAAVQTVTLAVYETTSDDSAIRLNALHLVIDVQSAVLAITEILVFQNTGAVTYQAPSGTGNGLKLTSPSGAFQLQPMSEGLEQAEQGLRYNRPIPPGDAQIVYAYSVDRASMGDQLTKLLEYQVGRIQVLISPSEQQVTSPNLTNDGVRQIGDKSYLMLSNTTGLQRGMSVAITFPTEWTLQDLMKWGMAGLAVLMVLSGIILWIKRPLVAEPQEESPTVLRDLTSGDERQYLAVLEEIADLEDQYEAGQLSDKVYQRRRNSLKNRAIRMRVEEAESG